MNENIRKWRDEISSCVQSKVTRRLIEILDRHIEGMNKSTGRFIFK